MALTPDHPMTEQEVLDNYEFKVAKKMLLREYPWIKSVSLEADKINKWNIIFIDLHIDPYELGREQGWEVLRWVTQTIRRGEPYWSPYLSSFYEGTKMYEVVSPLTDEMNDMLRELHRSPALPIDLRLPGDRKFQVGSFHTDPSIATPEDTDRSTY